MLMLHMPHHPHAPSIASHAGGDDGGQTRHACLAAACHVSPPRPAPHPCLAAAIVIRGQLEVRNLEFAAIYAKTCSNIGRARKAARGNMFGPRRRQCAAHRMRISRGPDLSCGLPRGFFLASRVCGLRLMSVRPRAWAWFSRQTVTRLALPRPRLAPAVSRSKQHDPTPDRSGENPRVAKSDPGCPNNFGSKSRSDGLGPSCARSCSVARHGRIRRRCRWEVLA